MWRRALALLPRRLSTVSGTTGTAISVSLRIPSTPTLSASLVHVVPGYAQAQPLLLLFGAAGVAAATFTQLPMQDARCASSDDDEDGPGYKVDPATRKKYGRYLPWQRLNVDQVPLPFVNDMETTYEEKGATRVSINQGGASLGKRQATGQVCFRPCVPPPQGCTNDEARELYKQHLQM